MKKTNLNNGYERKYTWSLVKWSSSSLLVTNYLYEYEYGCDTIIDGFVGISRWSARGNGPNSLNVPSL